MINEKTTPAEWRDYLRGLSLVELDTVWATLQVIHEKDLAPDRNRVNEGIAIAWSERERRGIAYSHHSYLEGR